ncbi:hypothetical protein J2S74_004023 [Evansella vedderi]|uniref:Uncharacterized protein n=1 Tax=Evansella vedderi TaxID=38282 RepID=A0ABU0A0U4_9BACI|nr:hypothetical protein [Evansella vedderi]MDQ0256601.1 hypothetical protein [Evansella vedderi]
MTSSTTVLIFIKYILSFFVGFSVFYYVESIILAILLAGIVFTFFKGVRASLHHKEIMKDHKLER